MAVKGLWNIGPFNVPDTGFNELLSRITGKNIGPQNALANQTYFGTQVLGDATQQQSNISRVPNMSSEGGYTSAPSASYQPSTSGQPTGSAGPVGPVGLPAGPDPNQYLNDLRAAFGSLRSSIEGQLPGLENQYNTIREGIEGAVGRAKETRDERLGEIKRGFGENLKNLLSSDRELGERQQGVFSGLNALDSSAFADAQIKRQQNLFDTQGKLGVEKTKTIDQANREYAAYESEANNNLAALGNQYLSARSALQQALAQGQLNEATAIQNAMQQIQSQAQQIQSTIDQYRVNLLGLQAQGVDVVGNLNKLGSAGLNSIYGNYASNYMNPTMSNYFIPQSSVSGQGYIGSQSEDERRRLLGQ